MIKKPARFTIFNCARGVKIQVVHRFMPRVETTHIVTDPAQIERIYHLVGELCDLDYLKPEKWNFYER